MKCRLFLLSLLAFSLSAQANNEQLKTPKKENKISLVKGGAGFVAGKIAVYSVAGAGLMGASLLTGPFAPGVFLGLKALCAMTVESLSNVAGIAVAAKASGFVDNAQL